MKSAYVLELLVGHNLIGGVFILLMVIAVPSSLLQYNSDTNHQSFQRLHKLKGIVPPKIVFTPHAGHISDLLDTS